MKKIEIINKRNEVEKRDRIINIMSEEKDGSEEEKMDRIEVLMRIGEDKRVKREERLVNKEDVR